MKYVGQYLIIAAIGFVSEVLNSVIPAPIPTCIYGIVILFFLLFTKILKLDDVKDSARFLVDIQPVMFVPAGVGLMVIWGQISDSIVKYVAASAVSCIIVMCATGKITQLVIKMTDKKKEGTTNEGNL